MNRSVAGSVFLVALLFALSLLPMRGDARAHYTVSVDGGPDLASLVEMREGELMIAIRPLVEAMGGEVKWNGASRKVTIRYGGSQVAFWEKSRVVFQDGTRMTAPVTPYITQDTFMVPGWWAAARLGAEVQFTGQKLQVSSGRGKRPTVTSEPLMSGAYLFPFAAQTAYEPYYDSWGDDRSYQRRRFAHEGTDIVAPKGTPILSVTSGKIVRFGWNRLGGYRVTVEVDGLPGYLFYYAHMDGYAEGIRLHAPVKAGQVLGYVGSTGEGPERTEGRFVSHLHFGIYTPSGAINPYPFLRYWEQNQVARP